MSNTRPICVHNKQIRLEQTRRPTYLRTHRMNEEKCSNRERCMKLFGIACVKMDITELIYLIPRLQESWTGFKFIFQGIANVFYASKFSAWRFDCWRVLPMTVSQVPAEFKTLSRQCSEASSQLMRVGENCGSELDLVPNCRCELTRLWKKTHQTEKQQASRDQLFHFFLTMDGSNLGM